jgi:hypothetical protein
MQCASDVGIYRIEVHQPTELLHFRRSVQCHLGLNLGVIPQLHYLQTAARSQAEDNHYQLFHEPTSVSDQSIIDTVSNNLSVAVASIVQLVIMYAQPEDPFLSWKFALLVLVIQALGIVTACGPYLRPFLDSINSGMIGNDDIRRRQGGTVKYYNNKDLNEFKNSKGSKRSGRALFLSREKEEAKPETESELQILQCPMPSRSHELQMSGAARKHREQWEAGSQSSRTGIIQQTTTFGVSSEVSD